MGWANTVGTNMDIEARAKSVKFEVVPESIRVGMGSEIPRIRVETKKKCVGLQNEGCETRRRIYRGNGVRICHVTQGAHLVVQVTGSFPKVWGCHWGLP